MCLARVSFLWCIISFFFLYAHTADYIRECFEDIIKEFSIEKTSIHSMTTDGGSNIVSAVKKFLGDNKRIPCLAHLINLIVDAALTKDNAPVLEIDNQVKSIVTYFKQSVNAMDELRAEQHSKKKRRGSANTHSVGQHSMEFVPRYVRKI